jgi:tetratricopeptide (TPR) repeat protein
MASLIPGYEYDIFISYRQKDNKYDGWVTEFVDNLKRELEATFKEEVSVYFDINPHDGLLETHDVDASLKEKLKCLVFIPIISRTYCAPKSFAWEHEFKAFIEEASGDQFGLKVKLSSGNVANRVLPVRIHDLDENDIQLCETVYGSVLRGVEFVYREPGVNRPLTPKDKGKRNLNKTIYRNQINKVANAVKEIISGLSADSHETDKEMSESAMPWEDTGKETRYEKKRRTEKFRKVRLMAGILAVFLTIFLLGVFIYPRLFKSKSVGNLRSLTRELSVAVLPFQNMTNDTLRNIWKDMIQENLISALYNTRELHVRSKRIVNELYQKKNYKANSGIPSKIADAISEKVDADIYLNGSFMKVGHQIRIDLQMVDTKTEEVLKTFWKSCPEDDSLFFQAINLLSADVTDFLVISKFVKVNPAFRIRPFTTTSAQAFKSYIKGEKAYDVYDFDTAEYWYLNALAIDSNFFNPMFGLSVVYFDTGKLEKGITWLIKCYNKKDLWPPVYQIWVSAVYASFFESRDEQIRYLKLREAVDDYLPETHGTLGQIYIEMKQYDSAISEYEKLLAIYREWDREFLKDNFGYVTLSELYRKTGQLEKEKKLLQEAEQYIPETWLNTLQALLAFEEKDTTKANKYIEKYLEAKKKTPFSSAADNAEGLGDIYVQAGFVDRAETEYRKAYVLNPDNTHKIDVLADFLLDNNRSLSDFSELMDRAIELAPDKIIYYNYLEKKGWGLYKQGKNKEALEILQKCWDEAPFKLYSIRSHYEEVKKAVAEKK